MIVLRNNDLIITLTVILGWVNKNVDSAAICRRGRRVLSPFYMSIDKKTEPPAEGLNGYKPNLSLFSGEALVDFPPD